MRNISFIISAIIGQEIASVRIYSPSLNVSSTYTVHSLSSIKTNDIKSFLYQEAINKISDMCYNIIEDISYCTIIVNFNKIPDGIDIDSIKAKHICLLTKDDNIPQYLQGFCELTHTHNQEDYNTLLNFMTNF